MTANVNAIPGVKDFKATFEMCANIVQMNEVMGNPSGCAVGNLPRLVSQLRNVEDELTELDFADASDQPALGRLDALCDIVVFTVGGYHLMGWDAAEDLQNLDMPMPVGNPIEMLEKINEQMQAHLEELAETPEAVTSVRACMRSLVAWAFALAEQENYNMYGAMGEVFRSNMSKLCENQEIMDATKAKFEKLKVPHYEEGEFPLKCVKASADCRDDYGNSYRKGKFLKSTSYSPPDLRPFLTNGVPTTCSVPA